VCEMTNVKCTSRLRPGERERWRRAGASVIVRGVSSREYEATVRELKCMCPHLDINTLADVMRRARQNIESPPGVVKASITFVDAVTPKVFIKAFMKVRYPATVASP
jgi:hypothetical protein